MEGPFQPLRFIDTGIEMNEMISPTWLSTSGARSARKSAAAQIAVSWAERPPAGRGAVQIRALNLPCCD